MGLIERYLDTVYEATGMRGVYPPNMNLELGDYGQVKDGRFEPIGNLRDLGIGFEPDRSSGEMHREFKSAQVSKVQFGAGAAVDGAEVRARARLELTFGSDFSVYYAVAGCVYERIRNIAAVGSEIVHRSKKQSWNDDWKVVTSRMTSSNTTLIVSREKNSKIVLEATADVPMIDMTDPALSLQVVYDSTASDHWITEKGAMTPFCWLYQIDRDLLGYRPTFERSMRFTGTAGVAADQAAEPVFVLAQRPVDPLDGWLVRQPARP
jgi:hypothetical protein